MINDLGIVNDNFSGFILVRGITLHYYDYMNDCESGDLRKMNKIQNKRKNFQFNRAMSLHIGK